MNRLYQVDVPHFCAGMVVDDDLIVVEAAPILRWAVGKHAREVRAFVDRKGGAIRRTAQR